MGFLGPNTGKGRGEKHLSFGVHRVILLMSLYDLIVSDDNHCNTGVCMNL